MLVGELALVFYLAARVMRMSVRRAMTVFLLYSALNGVTFSVLFLMYAQSPDGTTHNFLDFNRRWCENEPAHDGLGRTLWALGTVLAHPPAPEYVAVVKDCFDRTTGHVQRQSPRGLAYCILGLCEYLEQFPGVSDIEHHVELAAGTLVSRYREAV